VSLRRLWSSRRRDKTIRCWEASHRTASRIAVSKNPLLGRRRLLDPGRPQPQRPDGAPGHQGQGVQDTSECGHVRLLVTVRRPVKSIGGKQGCTCWSCKRLLNRAVWRRTRWRNSQRGTTPGRLLKQPSTTPTVNRGGESKGSARKRSHRRMRTCPPPRVAPSAMSLYSRWR